jgi:hypothetical protein
MSQQPIPSRMTRRTLPLSSFMFAGALSLTACTQALLGDKDYLPEEGTSAGTSGAGGGASTGAGTGGDGSASTGEGSGGGSALVCDKGSTACSSACVMLDSDAGNCGFCGHDCLGTACNNGLCEPEVIAGGLADPQGLALDGELVYWTTTDGVVRRAPKSGGAAEIVADGQDSPGAVAVDAMEVYWANEASGRVMHAAKDGSEKAKMLFKGDGLRRLAIYSDDIYLSLKLKKGQIRKVQKGSGKSTTLADAQPTPSEIQMLGDRVIWTGFVGLDEVGELFPGGYVRSVPRDGGPIVSIAGGEGQIVGLTVLGSTAVWADETQQRIRMRADGDVEPSTLVENQQVRGLASDGTNVVWSTTGGTVKLMPLVQGTARLLAVDMANVSAVAVDETHVYFLRSGSAGAVLRVAK